MHCFIILNEYLSRSILSFICCILFFDSSSNHNGITLAKHMEGCEGFVFAAGVDERVEGPAPIYDLFKKYNIDPIKRLFTIAKKVGVKHVAICGSYFSYFAKKYPKLELTKWHPYIRSRIDQENAALAFSDADFDVTILELPYTFGTQPGRKPVWMFMGNRFRIRRRISYIQEVVPPWLR